MIFKNQQESASLLAQKIKEEIGDDLKNYLFTYIDLEDKNYCQLITQKLNQELKYLPDLLKECTEQACLFPCIIILDNGNTNGQEYNEFTDKIRKKYPEIKIIIAVPIIPESEEKLLQSNCDSLIYLHADPLFFSIHQFYESN